MNNLAYQFPNLTTRIAAGLAVVTSVLLVKCDSPTCGVLMASGKGFERAFGEGLLASEKLHRSRLRSIGAFWSS